MSVINPVISQTVRPVTNPVTRPPGKQGGGARNPALTRDLEAWWDMNSNTTVTDETGNGFALEKAGAGTLSPSTTIFRTGGYSIVTPSGGSSAYLWESASAAPAILQPSGDFTFFIWARPSDTVTRNLCGVWSETGDQRAWRILHNSTGWRFEISTGGTSGTVTGVQSSTGGALTWAFICVTRKGNTVSLYVNDDSAVTASVSGAMHTSTAQFQIGQVQQSADAGFYGTTQNSIFDTAAMWSRALRGRDINERATSLYANGAGHDYAAIGNVRGYASYSAAVASGDNWKDAQIIRCVAGNGVADFKYFSALATNTSGLLHRFPSGDGATEINTPTLLETQAATDPDTWTGWTDTTVTGTKGVDYDYRAAGGRAIFEDLNSGSASAFQFSSPDDTSDTHVDAFWHVENLSAVADPGLGGPRVLGVTYQDSSNERYAGLYVQNGDSEWSGIITGAAFVRSGVAIGTESAAWMYVIGSSVYYWFEDKATPSVSNTAFSAAGTSGARMRFNDLNGTAGDECSISIESLAYGHLD